ncbi:MAG: biosynthetic arginine decarboxylase [Elusimicrobiota bacterium]
MDTPWGIKDSAKLYNLKGWGQEYFKINNRGHLCFKSERKSRRSVDIKTVVDDITARGVQLPVLIRFQDIVRDRVVRLNESFLSAIKEHNYKGRYFGVYPIKVNQLREVVEEILDAGERFNIGLEAGSKSELMAVLAMNSPSSLTIVNGYKDAAMMRLACIGLKLGKKIIVVIEKPNELELLLKTAREFGVRPVIGLRCRLSSGGSGKWATSTGHGAKFGLTTPELVAAVKRLRQERLVDTVKLLHFHIGSQVNNIQSLKDAVREGARIYAKLRKMGVGLEYLDCGGGLGVDYEGTNKASDFSMNYTLDEYVRDVVYSIQEVCTQEEVPEPHIVTESGRSLTAHHAVLVVNVFENIAVGSVLDAQTKKSKENRVVEEMRDIISGLTVENLNESYHDGQQRLKEAETMFQLGFLDLEDKARAENLFWNLCREIHRLIPRAESIPQELRDLSKMLYDQYLVNFSVFLSMPDSWAIDHLFPIMPLHRLEEKPDRKASLVDITCDSDGRINHYCSDKKVSRALPLHALRGGAYYLGVFLMGAYQATMGDIHNLFGRVNEVHVFRDDQEPGGYYIEEVLRGQTVRDVLASIQYSEFELVKMIKHAIETQVKAGRLKRREGVDLQNMYEDMLHDYTYIDNELPPPPVGVHNEKEHKAKASSKKSA